VLEQLKKTCEHLRGKPPWEVLGVPSQTRGDAAKRAFLEASRRYHPHRFGKHDHPDVARTATQIFILCKKAYDALSSGSEAKHTRKPKRTPANASARGNEGVSRRTPTKPTSSRPQATQGNRSIPPRPASPPPEVHASNRTVRPRPASPRPASRKATMDGPFPQHMPRRKPKTIEGPVAKHLRMQSDPDVAHEANEAANNEAPNNEAPNKEWAAAKHGVDRNEADAELAVAAGMKHLVAGRLGAAYTEFKRALELDPTSRQAELWRLVCEARVAKAEGHAEAARRKYEAVLELDPGHREALAATAREEVAAPSKGGRLGRWFGRD
jgi:tetratricopeptide (TPR) repeat protein